MTSSHLFHEILKCIFHEIAYAEGHESSRTLALTVIYRICHRNKNKKLAKTSKTPGRTQAINIFSIKEDINIVDLPGYGYAKISKVLREQLSYLIETYIKDRENLSHIFLLVDAKVGIKNSDIDMLDLINFFQKKFSIVFTKIDKCSKSHIDNQNNSILSLMKNYPNIFTQTFFTSIKTNEGIIDVQKEIYRLSKNL